ncbi:hypothetical protein C8R41DRAFT_906432 [Lentinula lateritia]|uniref:Uncharacterized protein n=1 Tax=Lentinula lateritia TaxID=40482 RepID=A0ABQ8UYR5_9AGAR|nr:hypothetical protein C8R41DRAFT_906432 [Lentinula lateritia]
MMSTAGIASPDLDLTFGALLCGSFIVILLFGIFIVQVYLYYKGYPKDKLLLKILVAFVCICELAHTICVTSGVYIMLITFYGHPETLSKFPLPFDLTVAFAAPVTAVVQAFYILRIYRFLNVLYIPIVLWVLCFLRFVSSYAAVGFVIEAVSVTMFELRWNWLFTVNFVVGAFVDVAVAGILVFKLWRERREAMKSVVAVLVVIFLQVMENNCMTTLTIFYHAFIDTKESDLDNHVYMSCKRLNARNNLRHLETETEAQVYELDVHPDGRDSLRSQAPRNRVIGPHGYLKSVDTELQFAANQTSTVTSVLLVIPMMLFINEISSIVWQQVGSAMVHHARLLTCDCRPLHRRAWQELGRFLEGI